MLQDPSSSRQTDRHTIQSGVGYLFNSYGRERRRAERGIRGKRERQTDRDREGRRVKRGEAEVASS